MPIDVGVTRIYHCPACNVDTPHTIKSSKGDMYGIICTNCQVEPSLVRLELRTVSAKVGGGAAGHLG
jgi:transcription elongation factor Elf1